MSLVFDNAQGTLGDLGGQTVGVAVLALDTEIASTVAFLSELVGVSGWEVDGPDYERQTADLRYVTEDSVGVIRYDGDPPTFDLTDVPSANAMVFYDTTGSGDSEYAVLFILGVEEGPGFAGWSPPEPAEGLALVGSERPVLSVVAGTNITVDSTDPQNPVISSTASGGGDVATVAEVEPVDGNIPTASLASALGVTAIGAAISTSDADPGDVWTVDTPGASPVWLPPAIVTGTPVAVPVADVEAEITQVEVTAGRLNPGPYICQTGTGTPALQLPDPDDYPGQSVALAHAAGSNSACVFWLSDAGTKASLGNASSHLSALAVEAGGRGDTHLTFDVDFTITGAAQPTISIDDDYNFASDPVAEFTRFFDDLFEQIAGWSSNLAAWFSSGSSIPLLYQADAAGYATISVSVSGDSAIQAILEGLPTVDGSSGTYFGGFDNATGGLGVEDLFDTTGYEVVGADRHDLIGNAPVWQQFSRFTAVPKELNDGVVGFWASERIMRDDDLHNDDDTWSVLVQGGEGYLTYRQIIKQIDTVLADYESRLSALEP